MKKITLIILCATMIACNKMKLTNADAKNNNVVWAKNILTLAPLEKDSVVNIPYLGEKNNFDKKAIFETVKKAVLNGKLKAYGSYPDSTYTVDEFKKLLELLGSNNVVKDVNHPGEFVIAPITSDDIVQLRFDEHIEMDTTNYTFNNKITGVTFLSFKRRKANGEIIGYKYLFAVKF